MIHHNCSAIDATITHNPTQQHGSRQWLNISISLLLVCYNSHTHTHPFNGPLSGTAQVSRYQKGKTNLDFTEARDSEWQWHQLGCVQVRTSLQTDNHASTTQLSFLQAGCPSCRPTNTVEALEAQYLQLQLLQLRPTIYCVPKNITTMFC